MGNKNMWMARFSDGEIVVFQEHFQPDTPENWIYLWSCETSKLNRHDKGTAMRALTEIVEAEEIERVNASLKKSGAYQAACELHKLILENRIRDKQRTEILREEKRKYNELLEKYNVNPNPLFDEFSLADIIPILWKMEMREDLSKNEIKCLEVASLNNVLATYFYRRYKRFGELWDMVHTCKHLRHAGLSSKVVNLLKNIPNEAKEDARLYSALYTTRGAAYRALGGLDDALQDAHAAIMACETSYHPHNLAGGIFFSKENFLKGEWHFAEAVSLGSDSRYVDAQIRDLLDDNPAPSSARIADYLLKKDPNRYSWASRYLSS